MIEILLQEVKMHGDSFRLLASDACCLVYHFSIFIEQMKEQNTAPSLDFKNSVKDLFGY
jgi:hypothetical protein